MGGGLGNIKSMATLFFYNIGERTEEVEVSYLHRARTIVCESVLIRLSVYISFA